MKKQILHLLVLLILVLLFILGYSIYINMESKRNLVILDDKHNYYSPDMRIYDFVNKNNRFPSVSEFKIYCDSLVNSKKNFIFFDPFSSIEANLYYHPLFQDETKKIAGYILLSAGIDGEINNNIKDSLFYNKSLFNKLSLYQEISINENNFFWSIEELNNNIGLLMSSYYKFFGDKDILFSMNYLPINKEILASDIRVPLSLNTELSVFVSLNIGTINGDVYTKKRPVLLTGSLFALNEKKEGSCSVKEWKINYKFMEYYKGDSIRKNDTICAYLWEIDTLKKEICFHSADLIKNE
ncbi:MAG: hypothetical protein B7C24_16730 [Bacteroidetes bacterium 4572_77]|nr:MAG: hypothetical protein B7C24_16730 [Bacteroidetes bacterium 4572_77]